MITRFRSTTLDYSSVYPADFEDAEPRTGRYTAVWLTEKTEKEILLLNDPYKPLEFRIEVEPIE